MVILNFYWFLFKEISIKTKFILAVKQIKKPHLVEIKNLPNPSPIIKLALESICLLLGQEANDWKAIRYVIVKDNFIGMILTFDADKLT